jgi:hypothetical protein
MTIRSALDKLSAHVDAQKERQARATSRLETRPRGSWRFAIVGARVEPTDDTTIGEYGKIVSVEEPPMTADLASGLKHAVEFSAISRYMGGVGCELELASEVTDPQFAVSLGWTIIAGLRLISGREFIVPAMADYSWDTIAAAAPSSVSAQLLEDNPKARRTEESSQWSIAGHHCRWVAENLIVLTDLRLDRRFQVALECLSESYIQHSLRLATTVVWAGIEALTQVGAELTYRLSLRVAALTAPPGEERLGVYQRVRKLYEVRSRAVHGDDVDDRQLSRHVAEARGVLRNCLLCVVQLGRVPASADFDAMLMGVTPSAPGNGQALAEKPGSLPLEQGVGSDTERFG